MATNFTLTAVENNIPDGSNYDKRDYDTKISGTEENLTDDNHDKYM